MGQPRLFIAFLVVWFLGWGFLLLKFPRQTCRLLAMGKEPSAWNLKIARIVAYIGLVGGVLLLIELAAGILKAN